MITQKLINTFIKDNKNTNDILVRTRYGLLEAWTSIAANLILGLAKILVGIITNSISITADALHTLGDMITSIIVLLGFRAVKQPKDIEHPYGHGRAESIATLIIAILLIVAGIEFIHAAIDRLRAPLEIKNINSLIIIMTISVFFKEWLTRFSLYLAKTISSSMLEADAWHHRSDVFASIAVILAAVGAKTGYPRLDSIFAILIAGLIMWTGFNLARLMISSLIGKAPKKELLDQITKIAYKIKGVKGIHDIEIHDYGQTKVCSAHIEVIPSLTTSQSHEIANTVEESLKKNLGLSATVHVDIKARE